MTDPQPAEDFNDPRHIYQARAAQAAREAEHDFVRGIDAEISTPAPGIGTLMRRALSSLPDEEDA
ncbi:hypothetical protein [Catenuloplanes indicus]|uniref:Uncharacterized protein n=1 Tax=Catenuloplanes indicus TaxID=137267 RepID=A0AAE3VU62_9ACTN|nr:hypothetical protein [Catenuloplanes indicus]MDQ0363389.1 hypothetical protein [Catenuloplanes indicus]